MRQIIKKYKARIQEIKTDPASYSNGQLSAAAVTVIELCKRRIEELKLKL